MSLTAEGFTTERLVDIRREIIADLKSRLMQAGLSSDIETRPDSIFGLLIDTFAEREAALWAESERVYRAMYPHTATGASLDNAISFVGAFRRTSEKSRGYVCFYSKRSGIAIPYGTGIRQTDIDQLWQTAEDGTISYLNASDVLITPTVGTGDYTVTIDGKAYTHQASTASLQQILAGLVAALSACGHRVSSNGAAVRLTVSSVLTTPITLSSNLSFFEIGTQIAVETVEYTAQGASTGAIDQLSRPITGVTRVANLQSAAAGRKAESDEDLRKRYLNGEFTFGTATLPTFTYHLKNVLGVTETAVFENESDVTDAAGRPPHSVHCIVEGGLNPDIARAIYETKSAGISSHGKVSHRLITDEGIQIIRFDRPDYRYMTIHAVLTLLPETEETFSKTGYHDIKQALYQLGKKFAIGQDVLIQTFYRACYQTRGVGHVELTIGASGDAASHPKMAKDNITIAPGQKAVFDLSRITVS